MTSLAERLRSESFQQGIEQEKRLIALRFLKRGKTLKAAKDITGLSLQTLQKLQRETRH